VISEATYENKNKVFRFFPAYFSRQVKLIGLNEFFMHVSAIALLLTQEFFEALKW
jgi:hypothetical protein